MTRRKQTSDDDHGREPLDVAASDLLGFGQQIIAGMRSTTGEGEPDHGAQFDRSRRQLTNAGLALRSAAADDRWDGAGARAYADQNTRQQMRIETMAEADQAVSAVLVREALQIKLRRDTLDDQSDILARTSNATFPLQFVPRYGEAARLAVESTALSGALLASAQALHDLQSDVSVNAAELSRAVGRYAGVADSVDAAAAGGFHPPEPTGPPASLPASVHPQTSSRPLAGPETELGEATHVGG